MGHTRDVTQKLKKSLTRKVGRWHRHKEKENTERESTRSDCSKRSAISRPSALVLEFPDIDPLGAEAFVCQGDTLCLLGKRRFWQRRDGALCRFYVDQDTDELRWHPIHVKSQKTMSQGNLAAGARLAEKIANKTNTSNVGRLRLTDIYRVQSLVLDHKEDDDSCSRRARGRRMKRAAANMLHHRPHLFHRKNKPENHFEVIHQEGKLKLMALTSADKKQWVTGLQHLVHLQHISMRGMNVEVMSRLMFRRADVTGDGKIDRSEFKLLCQNLGMNCKSRMHWHWGKFQKYDQDNSGEITENEFVAMFQNLMVKEVLQKDFDTYSENQVMSAEGLQNFLIQTQQEKDSKATVDAAKLMEDIQKIDGAKSAVDRDTGGLTELGFSLLMASESNLLIRTDDTPNMSLPLSHYWINSSHNTYLEGRQNFGTASLSQYVEVLHRGCRCVEIDCCNGPYGDPVVTHKYASTPWLKFQDVIRTCKDHAFKTNNYPLILSIEQNCGDDQAVKCGNYLTEILGDMLLMLPEGGLEENLISPEEAQFKIIVKGKPKFVKPDGDNDDDSNDSQEDDDLMASQNSKRNLVRTASGRKFSVSLSRKATENAVSVADLDAWASVTKLPAMISEAQAAAAEQAEHDAAKSQELTPNSSQGLLEPLMSSKTEMTKSNHLATVGWIIHRFKQLAPRRVGNRRSEILRKKKADFDQYSNNLYLLGKHLEDSHVFSMTGRQPFHISSLKEKKSQDAIAKYGDTFKFYHRTNMTRVYPAVNATNVCKPMAPWLAGVQMVALNFQATDDEAMLLNEGIFRNQNGGCGYVVKPECALGYSPRCPNGHKMQWKNMRSWQCKCGKKAADDFGDEDVNNDTNTKKPHKKGAKGNISCQSSTQACFVCSTCHHVLCKECGPREAPGPKGIVLTLKLISAHFLPPPRNAGKRVKNFNPKVIIRIRGIPSDCKEEKTTVKDDNIFNPEWNEEFTFEIREPDAAVIAFQVIDVGANKESDIASSAWPVHLLRQGLRWAPLWDGKLRPLEHCGLFVHINKRETVQGGARHFPSTPSSTKYSTSPNLSWTSLSTETLPMVPVPETRRFALTTQSSFESDCHDSWSARLGSRMGSNESLAEEKQLISRKNTGLETKSVHFAESLIMPMDPMITDNTECNAPNGFVQPMPDPVVVDDSYVLFGRAIHCNAIAECSCSVAGAPRYSSSGAAARHSPSQNQGNAMGRTKMSL